MKTIIILSVIAFAVGGLLFFRCNNNPTNTPVGKKPFLSRHEAENSVEQLVNLGYYNYADPNDIDSLKADLLVAIADYGILSTIYSDNSLTPKDFRYYSFDGETVFEQGGFTSFIQDMKPSFQKIGLNLEITNHVEESDPVKGLNHEITLNGKRYMIFKDFKGHGWGEAAQKYAEIINDQLQIQNKDERLYLINAGNDGGAVFLTDKQFQLLDKLLVDDQWKPLKIDKWSEVFEVKPMTNS